MQNKYSPYYARKGANIQNRPGTWDSNKIIIFEASVKKIDEDSGEEVFIESDNDKQVGEYIRNYDGFSEDTFYPFLWKGKWYAAFSRNYVSTAIMSLPDCTVLFEEPYDSCGFCPTEYYVPQEFSYKFEKVDGENPNNPCSFQLKEKTFVTSPYIFLSGCIWGDDSSWKLEVVNIEESFKQNKVVREQPFGYWELPPFELHKLITMFVDDKEPYRFHISQMNGFKFKENKFHAFQI